MLLVETIQVAIKVVIIQGQQEQVIKVIRPYQSNQTGGYQGSRPSYQGSRPFVSKNDSSIEETKPMEIRNKFANNNLKPKDNSYDKKIKTNFKQKNN